MEICGFFEGYNMGLLCYYYYYIIIIILLLPELLWRSAVSLKDIIWYFVKTCKKDVIKKNIYNDTETGLQKCGDYVQNVW